MLSLVAGATGLWVLAARLLGERTPEALRPGVALGRQGAIVLATAVASVATAGSLYYSEVAQYTPCRLCWYQRIGMYPLVLVLGIAAWRDDPSVRRYALPLAAVGGIVSAYHYLLQWFPQLQTGVCDPGAPCAAFYVREFGFVSIPFMALMGFVAIGALLTTIHTEAP